MKHIESEIVFEGRDSINYGNESKVTITTDRYLEDEVVLCIIIKNNDDETEIELNENQVKQLIAFLNTLI